jgi:hypothetical protein
VPLFLKRQCDRTLGEGADSSQVYKKPQRDQSRPRIVGGKIGAARSNCSSVPISPAPLAAPDVGGGGGSQFEHGSLRSSRRGGVTSRRHPPGSSPQASVGINPIVTLQYSSTTLYQVSYVHIQ